MSAIVKYMIKNYYSLDDTTKFDLNEAIESLTIGGILSNEEVIILKLTIDGIHCNDIADIVVRTNPTINSKINKIAAKISSKLGDDYSDKALLNKVEHRLGRPLTLEEEKFCWQVIKTGHPLKKGRKELNIFNLNVEGT